MSDVTKLVDGKYKVQFGRVLTTYTVSTDGKVTITGKDGLPKTFVFKDSDIETVYLMSKLLSIIVKECRKGIPRPEVEISGHRYTLADKEEK